MRFIFILIIVFLTGKSFASDCESALAKLQTIRAHLSGGLKSSSSIRVLLEGVTNDANVPASTKRLILKAIESDLSIAELTDQIKSVLKLPQAAGGNGYKENKKILCTSLQQNSW